MSLLIWIFPVTHNFNLNLNFDWFWLSLLKFILLNTMFYCSYWVLNISHLELIPIFQNLFSIIHFFNLICISIDCLLACWINFISVVSYFHVLEKFVDVGGCFFHFVQLLTEPFYFQKTFYEWFYLSEFDDV